MTRSNATAPAISCGKDGKRITTRTAVAGQVGSVFQAAGIALPSNLHERAV